MLSGKSALDRFVWEHRPVVKEHAINFHPIKNTYLIIKAGNGSAFMQLVLVLLTGKTRMSHQGTKRAREATTARPRLLRG